MMSESVNIVISLMFLTLSGPWWVLRMPQITRAQWLSYVTCPMSERGFSGVPT